MGFLDKLIGKTADTASQMIQIMAPVGGTAVPLEQFPDEVFSQSVLGPGCGILPEGQQVLAPVSGQVSQLADTLHAIGITGSGGVEVLIHVGVDTVEMAGSGFRALVSCGQKVHAGDPLIVFDRDAIRAAGHSDAVAIVIPNGDAFSTVELKGAGAVAAGDLLLEIKK